MLSRIVTDPDGIRSLLGIGLMDLCGGVFELTIALGILFWLDWRLTAAFLVFLGVLGGGLAIPLSRLRPLQRERAQIQAEVVGRLTESLAGMRTVKAYAAENHELAVFSSGLRRLCAKALDSATMIAWMGAASQVVGGLFSVLIAALGGRAVLAGHMTLGDLALYLFVAAMVASPVLRLPSVGSQLTEAGAALDRIRQVTDLKVEDLHEDRSAPLREVHGTVRFERVGFEYAKGTPVLADVSFEAKAGTTTALVGPSGAGKSTLLSLVMGLLEPTQGRILVDGIDLATVRRRDFRRSLGVVFQDNFLFDGTIAENIAYARRDASREEIERVARLAHCEEFVERLGLKFDTVVGERGVRLSTGQRQRVAIARALLADPRILLLDEATSSLDTESERLVQEGLRDLLTGRTTFLVAHRLSTIKNADQILVLDNGRVEGRGTHQSLLESSVLYRRLYYAHEALEQNARSAAGGPTRAALTALELAEHPPRSLWASAAPNRPDTTKRNTQQWTPLAGTRTS